MDIACNEVRWMLWHVNWNEMNEMHEFIFQQGFLILLVVFWFLWFIMLERNGLRDKKGIPTLADLKKYRHLEVRNSLPKVSLIALFLCALLAIWSTYEVALNDDNLKFWIPIWPLRKNNRFRPRLNIYHLKLLRHFSKASIYRATGTKHPIIDH